jgi:hypothetical protein
LREERVRTSGERRVTRVCNWCGVVIAEAATEGSARYAGAVTHSICSLCIAKVDAEIAAIAAVKDVNITFPCPNCPAEAVPYKVTWRGRQRVIYVRCAGCRLKWIEEAMPDVQDQPPEPQP